ncbi:hypothetical protein ACCD10_25430 [Pseudomonas sp. Pseusp122]|uniref:hypothetical protein n=1 Tax=unclassified Pseudomonas TaxID=196821 RepID=UPI0039A66A0B
MQYTLVRIDFFSGEKCGVCPKPLTSGKARVLVDEAGNEVFVGPVCAQNKAVNGKAKVPDLTAAAWDPDAVLSGGGAKTTAGSSSAVGASQPDNSDRVRAESYLLLRTEKLPSYEGMSYGKLADLHRQYLSEGLTDNDVKYLLNLMAKVQTARPEYSYRNLQAIYACDFWIKRFLAQDASDFIASLQTYLKTHLALTPGQIGGLNKWFNNQPGMISIKPEAFAFDPSKK